MMRVRNRSKKQGETERKIADIIPYYNSQINQYNSKVCGGRILKTSWNTFV